MSEVVVHGARDLAERISLDVVGSACPSVDAELVIRSSVSPTKSGRVTAIEDSGARAVIEVASIRWWLRRRDVVQVGGRHGFPWEVGGKGP